MSWAIKEARVAMRIAQAKALLSSWVNCALWVRKPGPTAEVAIKKAAPSKWLMRPPYELS
ncbi:hypothetical protein BN341_17250 [Helicobacter heilmannii ASB1.4]|nr:hypothetical protein BN341_17250 [Helicobacter heilmannii ASB1.4]